MKVPRYSQFTPASKRASEIKKKTRSRDTKAELALRRALWKLGLRYQLHDARLPGKPDIIFVRAKVVVFVDGDFWHGRHWRARKPKLARGANAAYWIPKIEANIKRDERQTNELRKMGWMVSRFWETDIASDVEKLSRRLAEVIRYRADVGTD
jgi:DNA mismatch endonuclease, patch repair protein